MVLRAEVMYFVGDTTDAVRAATGRLKDGRLTPSQQSRCWAVLAQCGHDLGSSEDALLSCQRAVDCAERAREGKQIAATLAQLLERGCDSIGFRASLPLATRARRAAISCGDSLTSAGLHLAFGRLEARVGHLDLAKRHFQLTRKLLEHEPNPHLVAALDLDECGLLTLLGDLEGAIELAQRGAVSARVSGWEKGRLVAAANLAFLLVSVGDFARAAEELAFARQLRFRSKTYDLVLSEMQAQMEVAKGDADLAEATLRDALTQFPAVPVWYRLSVEHTRVRVLLHQKRWRDAVDLAENCARQAARVGAGIFVSLFKLAVIEASFRKVWCDMAGFFRWMTAIHPWSC